MLIYFIIGLAILGLGIRIYLINKSKKKYHGIKNYEDIRDKLTKLKDIEEEKEPSDNEEQKSRGRLGSLGNLLGGFIVIIIGINLIPTFIDKVSNAQVATNVTGAASTILGLTPLFFALGIMSAGVALTVSSLRKGGLM